MSSSISRPSSKQGQSPSLCFSLILCRMNFWWLEMSKFSSSSLCWRNIFPHSQYRVGKWTATKSFLAIILFLALCRQPHSVLRKLCVKEWLLSRLLSRALTPSPIPLTHFLLAFLHIHVCLNADGIKRLLLPHSISVFLFYLLLQVEGICGMHTVPDCPAARQTTNSPSKSRFCMISIHFVCCFSPTHMSQANPKLASTTCLYVLCLRLEQRPCAAAVSSPSLGGVSSLCSYLHAVSFSALCLSRLLSVPVSWSWCLYV